AVGESAEVCRRGFDGDAGGVVKRIAVGAGTERGQGDRVAAVGGGEFEGLRERGSEKSFFAARAAIPDRADGMDHVLRLQVSGCADDRRTGGAAVRISAARVIHDRGAAGAVNRSVDAAAASETTVSGVDDGINLLPRDVADDQLQ